MSQAKLQNTAIFITVLSVYLGLALIGAPPHILAQAASTKIVEVQAEKENDDDSKVKFDAELECDTQIVEKFEIAEAILIFFNDLKKLKSIGKLEDKDLTFLSDFEYEDFDDTPNFSRVRGKGKGQSVWLSTAIADFASKAVNYKLSLLSDEFPNCDLKLCRETEIVVELNKNGFLSSFNFKKSTADKAKIFAAELQKVFLVKEKYSPTLSAQQIYANTTIVTENSQVFIVTRLPRASIDEFLKEDAKASEK